MDANGFLRFIWPDTGYYCIATPINTGGYRHYVYPTVEEASKKAEELDKLQQDVYYCISTLAESHVILTDSKGKEKRSYRVKQNLHHIKVFFFELDVAKPGEWETLSPSKQATKYKTREEAITALKDFCKKIGWPAPTIISSGWGFHVYFPLAESIPTHEFDAVSRMLKKAAKALQFKLDLGALDLTRVFRVVGTHNYKRMDDIRPVELLKQSPCYSSETLKFSLEHALKSFGVPKELDQPLVLADYFGESNITYDNAPVAVEGLMKCGAIREVYEAQGDVPYYHWWHAGQVLRFADNGRQKFHEVSSGSRDYDYDYTEQVLDRFENNNVGPTLCDTFGEHVDSCKTCPHLGKIKSPIVLGRTNIPSEPPSIRLAELDPDSEDIIVETIVTLPDTPQPFKRSGNRIFAVSTDGDGGDSDVLICHYDLYPIKRAYYESQDREYVVWRMVIPLEGERDVTMPSADMYDKKLFTVALVNSGLYVEYNKLDLMRDYMTAYIRALQAQATRDYMLTRLGWRDNNTKFVLGSSVFSQSGEEICEIEKSSRVATAIRSSGSLDAWKQIVSLYNHEDFVAHQFAFATAFGAPLMTFTGVSGGMINLVGRSGEGKSSVQRLVNSVWGHPLELMLPADMRGSTYYAKIEYLNTMGNLPVCAEEITDMAPADIGALAYSINQGSGRWGLTQDRKLKASAGMWCLTMLSSSNSSVVEKLTSVEGASAKALRIMELRLPMVEKYTKNEFQTRFDLQLKEVYGVAGRVYMRYVLDHLEETTQLVAAVMGKIDKALDIAPEERVWSAMAATNLSGLMIAKQCGLHDIDIKPVYDYVLAQIKNMRDRTVDIRQSAAEALAEYMNEQAQGILTVEETAPDARAANTRVISAPTRAIVGRYDVKTGLAWIAATPFKLWCVKHGRVYQDTLSELSEYKVTIPSRSGMRVLGAGTQYRTGQVKCLIINTNAEAFGGFKLHVVGEADTQLEKAIKHEQGM